MLKDAFVTIMVKDMKKAVEFYTKKLGLKLSYESKYWSEISAPGMTIGLHIAKKVGSSDMSIGFTVTNLEKAMEKLKANGIKFAPVHDDEYVKFADFEDPDKNPFYIVEMKK